MSDAKKRENQPQTRLFPFIIAWATVCFLASVLNLIVIYVLPYNTATISNLAYMAALSTSQFFVMRRYFNLELQSWIALAIAGAVALIFVRYAFDYISLEFLPRQIQFAVSASTLWGVPAFCQWFALRKRFSNHLLWLLATIVTGPLGAFFATTIMDSPGITYGLNPPWLSFGVLAAGFAVPSIVQGLILYVVVKGGGKADALNQAAT